MQDSLHCFVSLQSIHKKKIKNQLMQVSETARAPKISQAVPTAQKERIVILDSLRGFAILGILLMNILNFSLPGVSHDPSILNETGINFNTWYFISLVPDGTQRALFSMLFGGGIILFVRSAEKKVEGIRPADYFFRRQLWLLVFSLFDVFILLWSGDILLDYALWGMVLFTFRNLSPKALLVAAGICLLFMLARENRDLYKDKKIIARGEAIAAMDTTKVRLSPGQKEQLAAMNDFKERVSLEKSSKEWKPIYAKQAGAVTKTSTSFVPTGILTALYTMFFSRHGMFCCSCFLEWLSLKWEF